MKIAMLYASWEKFGEPWSTPQGVKREFEERGFEVKHYNLYHDDGAMLPGKNMRSYSNQGINLLHHEFSNGYRPDIILCMDYGPWDAIQFDKKFFPGSILIAETGDEPQSHRNHWPKRDRVHLLVSPDAPCTQHYNENGGNAIWWTHHADENIFRPYDDVEVVFDCVTTCGPRRNGLTEQIQKTLGEKFNNERYFHGEEHARRLCMGNIVFQCSQYGEVTRRIFEGMACGKMVLTDRLEGYRCMDDLFLENEEIVYYDNAEDAIEKIRYYTDNSAERERIALNGYRRVMQDHTVKARVDQLLEAVNDIK